MLLLLEVEGLVDELGCVVVFPGRERVVELRRSGAVRAPHVTLFDLAKAQDALRVSAARHLKGKLVLEVR